MSMPTRLPLAALACSVLAGACSSSPVCHSYVKDAYDRAAPPRLASGAPPRPVAVMVEFRDNGKPTPEANRQLAQSVEAALRASGVAAPAGAGPADVLKVTVDDRYDTGNAVGQGILTVASIGTGSKPVEDRYQVDIRYQGRQGEVFAKDFHPVVATACGFQPSGYGESRSADEAFDRVMQASVWAFLSDFQANRQTGHLSGSSGSAEVAGQ